MVSPNAAAPTAPTRPALPTSEPFNSAGGAVAAPLSGAVRVSEAAGERADLGRDLSALNVAYAATRSDHGVLVAADRVAE